jgi:hypothetical protein
MPRTGRPQTLDELKRNTVLALLSVGCSRGTAASYVNCDPKTIYNTARRDPYFAERLARAENTSEFSLLSRIFKAAEEPRYWRCAAWALERMSPDRFSRRSPDTVSPNQLALFLDGLMEMLVEEVPVAAYRKKILDRFSEFFDGGVPKLPAPQKSSGKNSPQISM